MLPSYDFLTEEIYTKFYTDITEFRTAFDLPINKVFGIESVQLHFNLFREEMRELFSAETRTDKIDAVIDTLYVLFGKYVQFDIPRSEQSQWELNLIDTLLAAGAELKFDVMKAWDIVHHSNMSKLCHDDNVAETIAHYEAAMIKVAPEAVTLNNKNKKSETGLWAVKVTEDSTDSEGKFYPAGKVLKSVDYTPADFSEL